VLSGLIPTHNLKGIHETAQGTLLIAMPTTIPTTTSSTRPGSPSAGDAYFETDTNNYIIYDGANWVIYDYDSTSAFTNTLSLSFDGVNDSLATNYSPGASSAFSVSMWVKSSNTTQNMTYFSNADSAGGAGGFQVLSPSNTKSFYVLVYNGSTSSLFNGVGGTNATLDIRDNLWHHLAVTINGTSVKIYKDGGNAAINTGNPTNTQGTPFATWTSTVSYTGNTGNVYYFGKNGAYPSYYYSGLQDEIAFFKTELSGSDISAIYNSGVPNDLGASGLNLSPDAYFRCGDGPSDTNSSSGTPSNADSVGVVTSLVGLYSATQSTAAEKPTYSNDVPI
jgi:hypothetical protein